MAQAIAETLRQAGLDVDLLRARKMADVSPYRAVILGAPMGAFRWMPEAMKFLRRHRAALNRIPVAYFGVCMTMAEDTEENRRLVESWMEPVWAVLEADARGPLRREDGLQPVVVRGTVHHPEDTQGRRETTAIGRRSVPGRRKLRVYW